MWNLFKKSIRKITHKPDPQETVIFKNQLLLDEQFTNNFIAGGGNFVYCEDEKEVLLAIKQISKQENIKNVLCFQEKYKILAKNLGIGLDATIGTDPTLMGCEYLSAYDGSIMISGDHTKGYKLNELSGQHIIIANSKQIVTNLSEALQRIREEKDALPSYISSLKGTEININDSTNKPKNIYLLLVENPL